MQEFKFAVKKTLPILFSYLFMGSGFGILLSQAGYDFKWALAASGLVYAGALQYVMIPFLHTGASLLTVGLTALLLNSRHIFYGISYIEKFKSAKKFYPYMIFSLTDETYAILNTCSYPEGLSESTTMLLIAVLNQLYWIIGSIVGTLIMQVSLVDLTGIDFCMTALFITIVIDQWKNTSVHFPAISGLAAGTALLLLVGSSNFILPALLLVFAMISIYLGFANINEEKRDKPYED